MENDIIYFSDFPNLQETGTRKDNGKFDLTLLPTQELKEEFRGYIMYRCKNGTFRALIQDRTAYNHIAKFLNSRINRRIKSLGDRNPEKWISLLKGWMLEMCIRDRKYVLHLKQDHDHRIILCASSRRIPQYLDQMLWSRRESTSGLYLWRKWNRRTGKR